MHVSQSPVVILTTSVISRTQKYLGVGGLLPLVHMNIIAGANMAILHALVGVVWGVDNGPGKECCTRGLMVF
jgi:hypothetical protein